ncbi:MAG TPA: 4-hydroxyphenylacetate 3-hydroxylase N-terminal domain-containing protein [Dehalococcoidia bacterium]|nr:4-hydroxyphenylacetate 3-hydroxylase N-terminal domain-containing protein [Dehalococcoidia bacterium]
MVITASSQAQGAQTGRRYIESLRDDREVWIDGERVKDVTTHSAFRDMIHELARVYDLQNSDQYRDEMTFLDPESGVRSSLSWLLPRSAADLRRKRRNSELWNELTWGQLGRSPDILAPYITSLVMRKDALGAVKHPKCDFGENIVNYYKYCMQNDLFLTHALGDPQVDRSTQPQNEQRQVAEDEEIALHVVAETNEGVIVTGGKQLSTAAPHSNECYVSLSATFARRSDPRCVLAFSIPTNSPGLKILAREPVSRWVGTWGHPLHNLDEQDCMLFFQEVLVPWDRLFMLYDPAPMVRMLGAGTGSVNFNFLGWSNLCRAYARMRLMTAVATMVAEAIGVIEYREVASKLGEMATYCEVWRHSMEGVEHEAFETESGVWSLGPGTGLHIWFAQTSARMLEILREICGSGIIMQPSEQDLASPDLRPYLDRYMRGKDVDVEYKSRLFRLAHDLAASSYGLRQDIYEYWHGGDPNRNRINLLRGFDQSEWNARIKELLSKPLPHGEPRVG